MEKRRAEARGRLRKSPEGLPATFTPRSAEGTSTDRTDLPPSRPGSRPVKEKRTMHQRTTIAAALTAALALSTTVFAAPVTTEGTATGRHGDLTVAVTFDGGIFV